MKTRYDLLTDHEIAVECRLRQLVDATDAYDRAQAIALLTRCDELRHTHSITVHEAAALTTIELRDARTALIQP